MGSRTVNVDPTVSDDRENKFRKKKCHGSKNEQKDTTIKSIGNCYDSEVVDKVICGILCKLPVRSLMRFKCVCKPWQFLVEKDPYFIDLHFTHSKMHPKFFVAIRKTYGKAILMTADYLSSDEGSEKAVVDIHNIREILLPWGIARFVPRGDAQFFGPLNGFVGFYYPERYYGIGLLNVCTQETIPWIKSTFLKKQEPESSVVLHLANCQLANCQLGFDPATKRHKVISIFSNYSRPTDFFCEILTLGDHEWRIVEDIPSNLIFNFIHMVGSSVYLNGSIYYNTFSFMNSGYLDNDKIVVFDVASEKFRAITIPDFILYHPRDIDVTIVHPKRLLEMDGQLAILCRINGYVLKLWLYDDDNLKSKSSWREITIELPFIWDKDKWLTFHSVSGKYEIIIKSCQYFAGKICSLHYHSYNWRKKTFREIKINGIPSAIGHLFNPCYLDAIFTESLFHVQ